MEIYGFYEIDKIFIMHSALLVLEWLQWCFMFLYHMLQMQTDIKQKCSTVKKYAIIQPTILANPILQRK